jgi:hypothetical protein
VASSLLERFEEKYIPEPNSGCWLWTAAQINGYGAIKVAGRFRGAHRVSYELHKGPVPAGLVLDHLCRVPFCVKPDHLEPVTIGENISRGDNHHRRKTRCKRGHAFTEENTLILSTGSRACRTCAKARLEQWKGHHNG